MLPPVPEQASMAGYDAALKTRAILVGSQKLIDAELPGYYVQACEGWYMALSSSDRVVATIVISSLASQERKRAIELSTLLPPAPVF